MILLTLLDRRPVSINCDLIARVTAQPDTTLRMVTGESLVVREPMEEVVQRVIDFRARILSRAGLDATSATCDAAHALAAVRFDAEPLEEEV